MINSCPSFNGVEVRLVFVASGITARGLAPERWMEEGENLKQLEKITECRQTEYKIRDG